MSYPSFSVYFATSSSMPKIDNGYRYNQNQCVSLTPIWDLMAEINDYLQNIGDEANSRRSKSNNIFWHIFMIFNCL